LRILNSLCATPESRPARPRVSGRGHRERIGPLAAPEPGDSSRQPIQSGGSGGSPPDPPPPVPELSPVRSPGSQLPPAPTPWPAGGPPVGHIPPTAGTDGFAITGLVFGIIGFVPLAVIFGFVALRRIRRRAGGGRGLAIAALATAAGWAFLITIGVVLAIVIPDESTTVPASTTATDNGVSALPPTQIASSAAQAFRSASSVRMTGLLLLAEELPDVRIDLRYQQGNVTGTETIDGQRVDVITIGLTAYIKADQSFWRTYEGVRTYTGITRLRSKYLRVEASDPRFGLISGFPVLPQVLLESLLNDTDIEKGERKIVNGVPTIGLIGAGNGVLYVATQGPPYPIRLEGDIRQNAIDFLDYGKVLDINAPPDNQVVGIETLQVR
jgi:hypothetical protein